MSATSLTEHLTQLLQLGEMLLNALESADDEAQWGDLATQRDRLLRAHPLTTFPPEQIRAAQGLLEQMMEQDRRLNETATQSRLSLSQSVHELRQGRSGAQAYQAVSNQSNPRKSSR